MALRLSAPVLGLRKMSMVRVADDSGIVKAQVVGFFRNRWGTGGIGMKCFVKVMDSIDGYGGPKAVSSICVRRKRPTRRIDGTYISFSDNAVVPLAKNKPLGGTLKGNEIYLLIIAVL